MKIAATGFVSVQAGSVASANALLLKALLDAGHEVDFFSKPSFVDPRPAVGDRTGFRFISVVNKLADSIRRRLQRVPLLSLGSALIDAWTYNRLLVKSIRKQHLSRSYSVVLWMGDYARGTVPGVPSVSFAQGAPGTDARSIVTRRREIRELAGQWVALKWITLALLRLSRWGLPPLKVSDHIIVGSSVSCEALETIYKIEPSQLSALPYPIDLTLFQPADSKNPKDILRIIWLGRIVPRKRLDLFLNGIALAIQQGLKLQVTLVGRCGFIPGYEKWITDFPFPHQLHWIPEIPREKVPALLQEHDILIQPSDEENFGSSVAEAQACGLSVIVGHTNGNLDYLSVRDIHLPDDRPESLAAALHVMTKLQKCEAAADDRGWLISRKFAEQHFNLPEVASKLEACLKNLSASPKF